MNQSTETCRYVWRVLFLVAILTVLFNAVLLAPLARCGTVIHSMPFASPDYDSVRVVTLWDSLGTWVQASESLSVVPAMLDLELDDLYDWQVRGVWFTGLDSSVGWDDYLYQRGAVTTTHYPIALISPDYDSVAIILSDREAIDTTYTISDTVMVTLPIDTTFSLRTDRDNQLYLLWFAGDDTSASTTWLLYETLDGPAQAIADYVRVYFDVTSGVVSGGALEPRANIEFQLKLIGGPPMSYGGWGIIPKLWKARPVGGRVTFDVPPTTLVNPDGAYYLLTYTARVGPYPIRGTVKRFYVDTLVDPLNVLDADEAYR